MLTPPKSPADSSSNWRRRPSKYDSQSSKPISGVRTSERSSSSLLSITTTPTVKFGEERSQRSPKSINTSGFVTEEALESDRVEQENTAISEGRRLYIGNLVYFAKRQDIETLLQDYPIVHIDISIDAFTGRNLSYCFVELVAKEDAEQVMSDLDGKVFLGRPLKIRPGTPKRDNAGRHGHGQRSTAGRNGLLFDGWSRQDAHTHWKGYGNSGRRLFVGNLPDIGSHTNYDAAMRDLFSRYNIEAISKARTSPKGFRYIFIDFVSPTEATKACNVLNGKLYLGRKIEVKPSTFDSSSKVHEREKWDEREARKADVDPRI